MTTYSPADIAEIKRIRERSAKTLNESAKSLRAVRDAAALSSGTLATLTGRRDYETLDVIHGDFVTFCRVMAPRREWESWADAWTEFRETQLKTI